MNRNKHYAPIPNALWLVPGSWAFGVFFPELAEKLKKGEISAVEALAELQRKLRLIVQDAVAKSPPRPDVEVDDLVQKLVIRLATAGAARRYTQHRGRPVALIRGFASVLVHEETKRRPRPLMPSIETTADPVVDGDQLNAMVRREELAQVLEQLSPGERRALVNEFGPLLGYSSPIYYRRRRRRLDPNALPCALEILRRRVGASGGN